MKTTIYLSTGRGVSVITGSDRDWQGEVRLKDQHVQCVAADVNRKGMVYCGTLGEGAFKSDDSGMTWRSLKGVLARKVTSLAVFELWRCVRGQRAERNLPIRRCR